MAFVLPFGEPDPGFFPDTLMSLMAARAHGAGHRISFVRVYYDGRDPERDRSVRERLRRWLDERNADVVVIERPFDPAPIAAHVTAAPNRVAVAVSWGSYEPVEGIELVLGAVTGATATGETRRSPGPGDLVRAFEELLAALEVGRDATEVPGVSRVERHDGDWELVTRAPLRPAALPAPFELWTDHDVIAIGEPPALSRHHVFGNAGCPFAADPRENPHFAALPLVHDGSLSLLGCAFCQSGGDYQKRDDAEVVASVLEQAAYFHRVSPEVRELVLWDQHPVRYLARLLGEARARGLPATRWLFQTRADTFVRERERVIRAIEATGDGHSLELFLVGFESFSDRELARYNKGARRDELLRAVAEMRELRGKYPGRFDFARARGHSLVLWSPWTCLDDLEVTLQTIREHRLGELFDEVGRNRLRLHPDVPLFHAAARDGALLDQWQVGDEGAGRRKGYSREHPWRFLDPRARLAHALSAWLRERLGRETELDQLQAAVDLARRASAADLDGGGERELLSLVARELEALDGALRSVATAPGRSPSVLAASVDPKQDDVRPGEDPIVLLAREDEAPAIVFAAAERAAGDDGRFVALATDARAFSRAGFVEGCVASGIRSVSVSARSGEAPSPQVARELSRRGIAVELVVWLDRDSLDGISRSAELCAALGIRRLRVGVSLAALGLDRLAAAEAALTALTRSARDAGLEIDARPLGSGTAELRVPAPPSSALE